MAYGRSSTFPPLESGCIRWDALHFHQHLRLANCQFSPNYSFARVLQIVSCITACCGLPCQQHCVDVFSLDVDLTRFGMYVYDSWCDCSSWTRVSLGPLLLTWVSLRSIGCSLVLSYCYYRSNTGYCSISRQADSNLRYKWQRSNEQRYVRLKHVTWAMLLRLITLTAPRLHM